MVNTGTCYFCGDVYPIDELNSIEDNLVCDNCCNDHTLTCSRCGVIIFADSNSGSDDYPLCSQCYLENYTRCHSCDELVRLEDACYFDADEYPYCTYCFSDIQSRQEDEEDQYIHEYSYKPYPLNFYGEGTRFLGVELEIDGGSKSDSNAKRFLETANARHNLLYVKSDGSLNDGLELVSFPCSLSFHLQEFPWEQILKLAQSLNYRSHSCSTCGLHVHINRSSFGATEEEVDEKIASILLFIELHWPEMLIFSRRTEQQLNKWASRYGLKEDSRQLLDHAKRFEKGRYVCLNLLNRDTIEFRFLRGTLRYSTFLASLMLINEICHLTDIMFDEEIKKLSWSEFVRQIDPKAKPELIQYLKEKQLYVNEPVLVMAEEER